MDDFYLHFVKPALQTVMIGLVAMALFACAFKLFEWVCPFSIKKELEEDHNVSVGIVLGAFLIGMAIVIAAVAKG